jgi:hypothetical protein
MLMLWIIGLQKIFNYISEHRLIQHDNKTLEIIIFENNSNSIQISLVLLEILTVHLILVMKLKYKELEIIERERMILLEYDKLL